MLVNIHLSSFIR